MSNKTKLLIVDDHSVTLAGIKSIVEKIDFVEIVGAAGSGREALKILEKTQVDVLITDVEMDDIGGVELSGIVKSKYPQIKIIAITLHSESWIISKLLKLDIEAIVLKSNTDNVELLKVLQNIQSGIKYYSPEIMDVFFKVKNSSHNMPHLTHREREILIMICNECTSNEISKSLSIANSTVETHRRNLFVKLKVKSQSGLVREAIRHGFYTFE
nr:response regulator transcription factor [Bacteroidota bacterium]